MDSWTIRDRILIFDVSSCRHSGEPIRSPYKGRGALQGSSDKCDLLTCQLFLSLKARIKLHLKPPVPSQVSLYDTVRRYRTQRTVPLYSVVRLQSSVLSVHVNPETFASATTRKYVLFIFV